MNVLRVTYIICICVQQIVFIAGGSWLTHSSGNGWWIVGGFVLCCLCGAGFTRRVDSWGVLGKGASE